MRDKKCRQDCKFFQHRLGHVEFGGIEVKSGRIDIKMNHIGVFIPTRPGLASLWPTILSLTSR